MRKTVSDPSPSEARPTGRDFLRTIIDRDLAGGRFQEVVTRFPPEPNGYLHIGHAMSICLNFGIAEEYGGRCHLRFDDTNPLKEDPEFAEAIKRDVRWLGFEWDELYYASDYFDKLYDHAETLVEKGKAYVDSQSEEEIRTGRGSLTESGTNSPDRDRSVAENLDLFRRMRAGDFPDGAHVLRAKIDMAHPNMIMRDPLLYRIRHTPHYRAGDEWCIYPLYDYAHCLEDAIEEVTHSFCTLEFENNREIYDWILDEIGYQEPRTHQYEFAGLNLEGTILSKRKLIRLVQGGHVSGWDDPRMPTLAGYRRRGVPPGAIRSFVAMNGVTKTESTLDLSKFEFAVRDYLNTRTPRIMAVLDPLEVVITNYPEGSEERLNAPYYPHDVPLEGSREVPFGGRLFVERSDFALDPPRGWRRLALGWEVRLRHAYTLLCEEVVTDPGSGEVTQLRCRYDPDTLGTNPDRGVKGVVHWVSADHALEAEVRLYDRLFSVPDPDDAPEGGDFISNLNPESLVVKGKARVEPSVLDDPPDTRYQFERTGYFWRDPGEGRDERLVFNRIVSLRDSWSRRVDTSQPAAEAGQKQKKPKGTRSPVEDPESRISEVRRASREADPVLAGRFRRYQEELGLNIGQADILTGTRLVSDLFEGALTSHPVARSLAGWIGNDLVRELKEREMDTLPFEGPALGKLVAMVDAGHLSRAMAKEVLGEMLDEGSDPEDIVRRRALEKIVDPSVLDPVAKGVLAAWPEKVDEYRAGKSGLLGFFVGQLLKECPTADPKLARELLERGLAP